MPSKAFWKPGGNPFRFAIAFWRAMHGTTTQNHPVDSESPQDDAKRASAIIERKMLFMNTLGQVCMTWWVSSVVFCGSTLGGVWLKADRLVHAGWLTTVILGIVLTIFFGTVVVFAIFVVRFLSQLEPQLRVLVKSAGWQTSFEEEVMLFKRTMQLGMTTFIIVLVTWLTMWMSLILRLKDLPAPR